MPTYYTPISTATGVPNTADLFNARLQQLDNAIVNTKNGTIETITEVFTDPTTLTLGSNVSGQITITQSRHLVDTNALASSGELATINGGISGQVIYLQAVNSGRPITILNGTGNILTSSGDNATLYSNRVVALFYNGTNWSDIGHSTISAVKINTQRFALSAPAASMSITGIPSTYKHLYLIIEARTDAAAVTDNLLLRANADSTAANYYSQYATHLNTTSAAAEVLGASAGVFLPFSSIGNTGAAGNSFVTVWIGNYASTTTRRLFHTRCASLTTAATGNVRMANGIGVWQNVTNAITSLTLVPVTGTNLAAGTAMTLYGYN